MSSECATQYVVFIPHHKGWINAFVKNYDQCYLWSYLYSISKLVNIVYTFKIIINRICSVSPYTRILHIDGPYFSNSIFRKLYLKWVLHCECVYLKTMKLFRDRVVEIWRQIWCEFELWQYMYQHSAEWGKRTTIEERRCFLPPVFRRSTCRQWRQHNN